MKKILLLLLAAPLLFSCEDYLERTQKSDLDEEQIFGSYQNFTGFIDNLYGKKLVRYIDQANCACLDMGDDVYGSKDFIASQTFPQGNYWWIWTNTWQNMITESSSGGNYGFWNGWEQIRICNQGFKNLHLLVGATDEQVRLIKGQLHFFRAWYHFELARLWGGLPYIDRFLEPSDDMRFPRLSFKETLMRIIGDLNEAAECLPVDWNLTQQGIAAPDAYLGRVTRGAALAAQGACLPLCRQSAHDPY